jgi:hypothetical protein
MAGYPENTTYHIDTNQVIDIAFRQGFAFEASAEITLAGGDVSEVVFTTGSKPVILYSRQVSYEADGINFDVYRDPDFSGGSTTDIEVLNSNDINPGSPECYFTTGATITDQGVKSRATIYSFGNDSNSGNGGALQVIGTPQILAPNSSILLIAENRDTQQNDFASIVRWVEVDRIPGLVVDSNGNFIRYNGKTL